MKRYAFAIAFLAALANGQDRRAPGPRATNNDWAITPALTRAVDEGLAWLAADQHPDGHWNQDIGFKLNSNYRVTTKDAPHVGVSALALMSFLAGGHLPGRGPYGDVLNRGLAFVVDSVGENGYITSEDTRMYSHAFATLFLAEIYGMTHRADVRRSLQQSVNLIVDSQNSEGGWRYKPFARESDMSITVCQVLALRSARNVGIYVPHSTIKDAETYVKKSKVDGRIRNRSRRSYGGYVNQGGAFRYQLRSQSRATFPLTAAGVTTLYAAGVYSSPDIDDAFRYLDGQLQAFNNQFRYHYFFYYGHYYAMQAYYIAGGQPWVQYFTTTREVLLGMQQPAGYWVCEPGPGNAFGTAVATLILQIPYQYLPIFQR